MEQEPKSCEHLYLRCNVCGTMNGAVKPMRIICDTCDAVNFLHSYCRRNGKQIFKQDCDSCATFTAFVSETGNATGQRGKTSGTVLSAAAMAFKAMLVVNQAPDKERRALMEKAAWAISLLSGTDSIIALRRRIFYRMIIAELRRDEPHGEDYALMLQDGERLTQAGHTDPVPVYMEFAKTIKKEDISGGPSELLRWSEHVSLPILRFFGIKCLGDVIVAYRQFLFAVPLDKIIRKHGLIRG